MACLKVRKRERRGGVRAGEDVVAHPARISPQRSPSVQGFRAATLRRAAIVHPDATVHQYGAGRPDVTARRCRGRIRVPRWATAGACRHGRRRVRSAIGGRDGVAAAGSPGVSTTSASARPA
jgi:hypothetical protein